MIAIRRVELTNDEQERNKNNNSDYLTITI